MEVDGSEQALAPVRRDGQGRRPRARARPRRGRRVWDADGNEYVDATAGLWFANVGHGRAEIADAVAEQLRTLAAHHVFGDQANRRRSSSPTSRRSLAGPRRRVFFGTGGGEAVDTAAKIVRRYWALSDSRSAR